MLLLKKFKQPVKTLEVEVEGEQDKEWPRAFNKIDVTFHIGWDGKYDKALVEQALDLACNRYCPIHATLSHRDQNRASPQGRLSRSTTPHRTAFLKVLIELTRSQKPPVV